MGYLCVTLPVELWPDGDSAKWLAATRDDDPLDDPGLAATWSPTTRKQVAKDYGRYLAFLKDKGLLNSGSSPGQRLEMLGDYIAHLASTGMATSSLLSRLRNLERAVAVMEPNSDRSALKSACRKLRARATPTRRKDLRVLDPAMMVEESLEHYDQLAGKPLTVRHCNHARDALMLAFLCHIPLRLASFAGLAIGRDITATTAGNLNLSISADALKEKRPFDCPVPTVLTAYLQHYLERVRPILMGDATCDALWVSMRGGPLSESAIYYQIIKMTTRLFGRPLNPHLIRDCVMTALAEDAPESVQAGARLLGHGSLRTSEIHYNHAKAASAQQSYHDSVFAIRNRPD
jgi:integrase